jgi:hypothetical protein
MYIALQLKFPYSCQSLMNLELSRQIFEEFSSVKFHKSQSSGSRVDSCERTDRQRGRQTDMTKLVNAFRNFANAPKIGPCISWVREGPS